MNEKKIKYKDGDSWIIFLKKNFPEDLEYERKRYPIVCEECGDIIKSGDDEAGYESFLCYKCY